MKQMHFILGCPQPKKNTDKLFIKNLSSAISSNASDLTITNSFTSVLAYEAIEDFSAIWIDWVLLKNNFGQFHKRLSKINKHIPIILYLNQPEIDQAIIDHNELLFEVIRKSELLNRIPKILDRILKYYDVIGGLSKNDYQYLRPHGLKNIIGNSRVMLNLYDEIIKVSKTDFTALVLGSSGTGKELVARAIHDLSGRRRQSFITLNCAAIPDTLQESELFGYEKGAFTGADQFKPGKFELANNGTLFLDEIGDMNLDLQAKLLRILEDGYVDRLGGSKPRKISVRLIAATNMNLPDMINENLFRADLYHRLNVIPIVLEGLDQRGADILIITLYLLNQLSKKSTLNSPIITFKLISKLSEFVFDGNVRELENILTRILFYTETGTIDDTTIEKIKKSLNGSSIKEQQFVVPEKDIIPIWKIEKITIEKAVERYAGNLTKVASALEISRSALYRKIKKYELSP